MRIRDLAPEDRPRERLWTHGVHSLTPADLLALVLRSGCRGVSALDAARSLLVEFGGLAGLAAAHPEELAGRAGIGRAKAAGILAAIRLGCLVRESPPPARIRTEADVAALVAPMLEGLRHERVIVVVLDAGHRMRRLVPVAQGGVDRSLFPVREILNAVLRNDGRAFAVAHNHPSGDPEPSAADREATRDLREAAKAVGVKFLGHVVV